MDPYHAGRLFSTVALKFAFSLNRMRLSKVSFTRQKLTFAIRAPVEVVIYVAGHPLLNRRCKRLPRCIRLRNDLYCVGGGGPLNSAHSIGHCAGHR